MSDQDIPAMGEIPSFVRDTNERELLGLPGDFWCPRRTGVEEIDVDLGVECGAEALAYARKVGCPMAIIYPLLEMVRRGSLGASEIGFIARIAKAAHMGALN